MKAKYENGNIEIINYDSMISEINATYNKQLIVDGVTDDIISIISEKEVKTISDLEILKRRERIDEDYNLAKERLNSFKEYVEDDTLDKEYDEELDVLIPVFTQNETTVFRRMTVQKNDRTKVKAKIQKLKDALTDSDYKVIKTYEAIMTDAPHPYSPEQESQFIQERNELRDEINELQELL